LCCSGGSDGQTNWLVSSSQISTAIDQQVFGPDLASLGWPKHPCFVDWLLWIALVNSWNVICRTFSGHLRALCTFCAVTLCHITMHNGCGLCMQLWPHGSAQQSTLHSSVCSTNSRLSWFQKRVGTVRHDAVCSVQQLRT
jgi:hypothetical protein